MLCESRAWGKNSPRVRCANVAYRAFKEKGRSAWKQTGLLVEMGLLLAVIRSGLRRVLAFDLAVNLFHSDHLAVERAWNQ
jgi:hypothetical protein